MLPVTAPLTPDAVRLQLARLESSPEFAGSIRLIAFLRFIVEETLSNGGVGLKEVVIGNAIYERDPPYDSRIDSTVRVEARRLRRKLQTFYRGTGASDPVVIALPTGGYVPSFAARSSLVPPRQGAQPADEIFRIGRGAAIAIMPFRTIPRDPDLETFADGLTDELIFTMGRADGLWITSRSTAFQYKNQDRSAVELAETLGVNAVLQGSVRQNQGLLRITIEVSDVDGFVVWSDRFDAPDDNRSALQDKIAKTLLSRVRFDSSRMRDMQIGPGPLALQANAKVYRARLLLDQQTPSSIKSAKRLFAQVAETAPDYARGHSGLADCAADLFRLGVVGREEALAEAQPAVARALEIDRGSIEANAALATIHAWLHRDPPKAEAAFEHARSLGVNARANRLYGVFLSLFGRHDKALRLFREARDIEPFSTQQDIAEAISHYQAGRSSALVKSVPLPELLLQPGEALVFVALSHAFAGKSDVARQLVDPIAQQCIDTPDYATAAAEIEAWIGDGQRARELLSSPAGVSTSFARATLAASLNETDTTLDSLEVALDRGELSTAWMRSDQRFNEVREIPRFRGLLERLSPLDVGKQPSNRGKISNPDNA